MNQGIGLVLIVVSIFFLVSLAKENGSDVFSSSKAPPLYDGEAGASKANLGQVKTEPDTVLPGSILPPQAAGKGHALGLQHAEGKRKEAGLHHANQTNANQTNANQTNANQTNANQTNGAETKEYKCKSDMNPQKL